jgi:5-methyltetrahydropteroyltriglutamate--homocysteine methyltransferase
VDVLHIDLVRNPEQLNEVLNNIPNTLSLSLGVVDGRNIWKNDFEKIIKFIKKPLKKLVQKDFHCSILFIITLTFRFGF